MHKCVFGVLSPGIELILYEMWSLWQDVCCPSVTDKYTKANEPWATNYRTGSKVCCFYILSAVITLLAVIVIEFQLIGQMETFFKLFLSLGKCPGLGQILGGTSRKYKIYFTECVPLKYFWTLCYGVMKTVLIELLISE